MENNNYYEVIESSNEDKIIMYMKSTKEELINMLIECNKHIDLLLASKDPLYFENKFNETN